MDEGIKISKKHGVNPSIEKCAICNKDIGIILFGELNDDSEAPKEVCLGHVCDECQEKLKENKERIFFQILDTGGISSTYYIIKEKDLNPKVLECITDTVVYLPERYFENIETNDKT